MPVKVDEPSPTPSRKLSGYDFYRDVLGSPKYIVAPMVEQSELPWRILSRRYGAQVVYSPMINAKMWATSVKNKKYHHENFNLIHGEEGGSQDRPLIIQFCGNDPELILKAAKDVEDHCDAVDINLGCPQDIARRGRFGAFLQDDWDLVYKIINTLHVNLKIPVTAKFRCFPSLEKTVEYAKMIESAGAQILTCHGRLREQRGHNTGLADWEKIRAVKQAISVPVFANGNVLYHSDIERCLEATGCDGVMSAEGNLYNPALFSHAHRGRMPPLHADLALEYLDIVESLNTPTSYGAVKAHLFKLFKPALDRNVDLRDRLARLHGKVPNALQEFRNVALEFKERMDRDAKDAGDDGTSSPVLTDDGKQVIPHWRAQPYFRPPNPNAKAPKETEAKTAATPLSSKTNISDTVHAGDDKKRTQDGVVSDGEDTVKRLKV